MLSMHPFNEHEMSDLSSTDIIVNSQVSNQLQNEFMSSPFIYISWFTSSISYTEVKLDPTAQRTPLMKYDPFG